MGLVRLLVGVLLAIHGIMHWPGFAVPWKLLTVRGIPYTTSLMGGLDLGDTGIRAFGVLSLVAIAGFVIAGAAIWRRTSWSVVFLTAVSVFSLVICLVNEPMSWEGVVIDAAILAVIAYAARSPRTGWRTRPAPGP